MEIQALHAFIVSNKFELAARINPKWFLDPINFELYSSSVMCLKNKKALTDTMLKSYIHENGYSENMRLKLISRLNSFKDQIMEYPENFVKNFQDYYIDKMLEKYYNHHINKDSTFESKYKTFYEVWKDITDNSFVTDSINLRDNIQEYIKEYREGKTDKFNQNSIPLENSGLRRVFGDMLRPWPVAIGAAPGFHKTSIMINLMVDIDRLKLPGLVFSFEDTIDTLRSKYLACKYAIQTSRIINNQYLNKEIEKINKETEHKNRIWVIDKPCGVMKFRELVDRHIQMYDIRYIIIDYFQLFYAERGLSKVESYEMVAKEFVDIRKEYNIPVVCLSQVNEEDGTEPHLTSFKWCKALAENVRQAIFLWGDQSSNLRFVKHGKNTFDKCEYFQIEFDEKTQAMDSVYEVNNNK